MGVYLCQKKNYQNKIGILFNERYSINLHSDILDTHNFFGADLDMNHYTL
ncbi:hypothetical protein OTSUT76_2072 [Orientia tsutsugamushi str. UT76]|nr:hypothetical protein OTSUT76_2072 [Orientia tsutsugamushi str. UT76]